MDEATLIAPLEEASSVAQFVAPLEQGEASLIAPLPESAPLQPMTPQALGEEAFRVGQAGVASIAGGIESLLRHTRVVTGGAPKFEKLIPAAEKAQEILRPKGPSPIFGGDYVEQVVGQTGLSLTTGVPGGLLGSLAGPTGIIAGGIASASIVTGTAEYDKFMEGIEKILRAQGASDEQTEAGLGAVRKYGIYRGLSETTGEAISDIAGAVSFKLGSPAAKAALGRANSAIARFGMQYLKAAPGEILGEELTTIAEYGAEGAAYEKLKSMYPDLNLPPIQEFWNQVMQTASLTAGQTLLHGFLFKGLGRLGKRAVKAPTEGALAPVVTPATGAAKELIDKYQIGGQTAAPETEKMVQAPGASIDDAIASLDTAVKEKQAARHKKKVSKTAEIIEKILAPEEKPAASEAAPTMPTPSTVIAPSVYIDIAASAQRVARDLSVPIDQLTTNQLIEQTGVDLEQAKASILAATRLEKEWARPSIAETVPSPAPAAPTEARPTPTPKTIEEQTTITGPTPVLKLNDGTLIKGSKGQQHFQVAEQQGIPFDKVAERGFINDLGEYSNPGNLKGIEARPKITEEAAALEAQVETAPPFVENLNVLSKEQQAELVSKVRKSTNFYKLIKGLTHPRGEGMTPEEFVSTEGVDELFQELGVPPNQQIATVKAVGLAEGYWNAEDLALDRFGTAFNIEEAVSAEFERLIDQGRATELETLGIADDQIDAALMKEASSIVEAKLQELAGSVLSEKNESTESQSLDDEAQAIVEQEVETVAIIAENTKVAEPEKPVVYKTKREAMVVRNALEDKSEYAVVGAKGAWTVERVVARPKAVETANLEKAVTSHSLFMTKDQTAFALGILQKMGKVPDRITNPEGYLDTIKVAVNNAYHNNDPVGEIWAPLRTLMVDLKEQAHRFNFDRRSAKELLEYTNSIAEFGGKVAEAVSGSKRYAPPGGPFVGRINEPLLRSIRQEIHLEESAGSYLNGVRLLELARADKSMFEYEKSLFSSLLANDLVRSKLANLRIAVERTISGVSQYWESHPSGIPTFSINPDSLARKPLGPTIIHEIMHHLTYTTLKSSPAWAAEVDKIRLAALQAVPEEDRLLVMAMKPEDFHPKFPGDNSYKETTYKYFTHPELETVYYGLTDNHEFVSCAIDDADMQTFLDSVAPTEMPRTADMSSLLRRFYYSVRRYVFGDTAEELRQFPGKYTMLTQTMKIVTAMVETTVNKSPSELRNIDKYDVRSMILRETPVGRKHGMDEIMDAIKAGEIHLPPRAKRDATAFEQMFMSPEAIKAVKQNPLAYKMTGMCIDAVDEHVYRRSLGLEETDRIFEKTTKQERIAATSALRQYDEGKTTVSMNLTPRVRQIVDDMVKFKEAYRGRMQDSMIIQLIRSSNPTEISIFEDVLVNGVNATEATKKWNAYARKQNKLRKIAIDSGITPIPDRKAVTTYATMKSLLEKYKDASKWGYDHYVTRAMRGDIIVTDEKGEVITAAQTTQQALERSVEILNNLKASVATFREEGEVVPNYPTELFITTDFHLDKEAPTLVSPKHYQAIRGRIVKAMKIEAAAIQAGLDKAAADKVLWGRISIKPKQVWTPFTEERHDILLGEEDISEILPLYVHMMEKKMAFDPYISFYKKHINEIKNQPGVRRVLEDQLEAAKGKYWALDRVADQALETLGIQVAKTKVKLYSLFGKEIPEVPPAFTEIPFSATRVIRQTRSVMAKLKLGYRVIAAVINLGSGMGHVWVKTSGRYVLNAFKIMGTEEGQAFIKRYAPDLGTSLSAMESGQIRSSAKFWSPLGMFQAPEVPNREVSLIATYLMSRDQGMNERAAVEAAKRGIRTQNFNYNIASIPKILRGPGGRLIGQFKTYLIKELEFIRTLTPGEWVKYIAMQIALGGPRGLMITLQSLPPLIAINAAIGALKGDGKDWLEQIDEWINVHLPRASRGVFGYFGVDASAPASFQFPQQWNDWAGITVSEVVRFAKEVAVPFAHGTKYVKWNLYDWSKGTAPIWKAYSDLIDSFYHDGWIWDNKGNKKFKVESMADKMKLALGMKPLAQGIAEMQNRILAREQVLETERVQNVIENAVRQRYSLGDEGVVNEIAKDCLTYQVMPETLVAAIERSEMDQLLKRTIKSRLSQRLRAFQARQAVEGALY